MLKIKLHLKIVSVLPYRADLVIGQSCRADREKEKDKIVRAK